jgi:hypothetical protein
MHGATSLASWPSGTSSGSLIASTCGSTISAVDTFMKVVLSMSYVSAGAGRDTPRSSI